MIDWSLVSLSGTGISTGEPGFWLLLVASFGTAMLSAILGMAGGIILLAVMLFYLDPVPAIAVHGLVQLVSNASRTVVQRRHVAWHLTLRYALLLLPMAYLGAQLALTLPPHATKLAIGVFVLAATWRPRWLLLGASPETIPPGPRFVALGGFIGFLSVIVGATGPLQAPFFLQIGLPRQAIVGTKAACQMLGHMSKTIVLGVSGFLFAPYLSLVLAMAAAVVAGTWVGSQLLERVNERVFTWLFKGALTGIALRFVVWDGWQLLLAS